MPAAWSAVQRHGALAIFALIGIVNFVDRQSMTILLEPIKREFKVSDGAMGFITGTMFGLVYVLAGFPIARWADKGGRRSILAACLAFWSAMTVACGFAQSYFQLALGRIGVAIGESGGAPTTLSMLSDLYPMGARGTVYGIINGSQSAGIAIGLALAGWMNHVLGWRAAFLVVGAPGLLLALVLRFAVREPHRGMADQTPDAATILPVREALAFAWSQRSLCLILLTTMLVAITGYGVLGWAPTLFVRVYSMSLAQVGLRVGASIAAGLMIGSFAGGRISDHLGKRDLRWYVWIGGIGTLLAGPVGIIFAFAPSSSSALVALFIFQLLMAFYLPSLYAMAALLVPLRMRTLSVGAVTLLTTLAGVGLGPLIIGLLNDRLLHTYGVQGVRISLAVITAGAMLGGVSCISSGHWLRRDCARVKDLAGDR